MKITETIVGQLPMDKRGREGERGKGVGRRQKVDGGETTYDYFGLVCCAQTGHTVVGHHGTFAVT